ncbi:DEAD/DEAH box helicase [Shewanella gelidii]|uniref:Helicase/SNF2 family domain protein n=1 Tax=Shewanella gelidii TaxID=1642821 RepID=A0A917N664_9GAMM|nr:DEAD/DEAH box helicase [Shewanella gelidii]MCL1096405.1 DEAD/DEAH box helicase [Shewanella gelidii]GGI67215.1 helicase/SNF2 family domain protein [Shewanella gelidii]
MSFPNGFFSIGRLGANLDMDKIDFMVHGTDQTFNVTQAEIEHCFNDKTLEQGLEVRKKFSISHWIYAVTGAGNRSRDPDGSPDAVSARVKERGGKTYHVGLTRYQDELQNASNLGSSSLIVCRCSCQVGLNCIHGAVVALSLALKDLSPNHLLQEELAIQKRLNHRKAGLVSSCDVQTRAADHVLTSTPFDSTHCEPANGTAAQHAEDSAAVGLGKRAANQTQSDTNDADVLLEEPLDLSSVSKLRGVNHPKGTNTGTHLPSKNDFHVQRDSRNTSRQAEPLSLWLAQLGQISQCTTDATPEARQRKSDSDEVIFILQEGRNGINVNVKRSRRGKRGDYLKGSQIAISDFRYFVPQWVDAQEQQILSLLTPSDGKSERFGELTGDVGYLALKKMVNSGRCFWEENRIPVKWVEKASLQVQWSQKQLGYQIQFNLQGHENWELLETEPLCFFDADYLTTGWIETDFSAAQLRYLQSMPSVPALSLESTARQLLQYFPAPQLTLPPAVAVDYIETKCVPNAYFMMLNAKPVLRIGFQYAEHVFGGLCEKSAQQLSVVHNHKQLVQVRRDCKFEASVRAELIALGLEQVKRDSGDGLEQWGCVAEQDELQLWLALLGPQTKRWQSQDWHVQVDESFDIGVQESTVNIEVNEGDKGWFAIGMTVVIDSQPVALLPMIASWLALQAKSNDRRALADIWQQTPKLLLPAPTGGRVLVDVQQIQPLLRVIEELFSHSGSHAKSLDTEFLQLPVSRAALLTELQAPQHGSCQVQVNSDKLLNLAKQLEHFNGIAEVEPPQGLKATLREYQAQGLSWISFLQQYQLGGILADDMGLGKTLQALAFILKQKQAGKLKQGALIICPTSLIGNWQQEAKKFTPALRVVLLQGQKRHQVVADIESADIVITTYPLISRDQAFYDSRCFDVLILDEAQQIKNSQAKVTRVVNQLNADFKLCLTGTPLENHLGELKSLMDFCLPGLLGDSKQFAKQYRTPIEKHADKDVAKQLQQIMAPFLLRRTKTQVASELPSKTEIDVLLEMESDQRNLYESIRIAMEKKLRELFARKGTSGSQIEFLDALLKLRQSCCDARLVKLEQAQYVQQSAKLEWLKHHLPEMLEEGRKVLIFSQFTSMLSLIQSQLEAQGIRYSLLTGETRERQPQIDAFQSGQQSVFLISLKAGGTGLNLTAADTVIHYDPWWNPAIERQATDRAYRIGQEKPVFVYKLIARGTVEEKIQRMQQNKQGLSESLFDHEGQQVWQGGADELLSLLN